MEGYVTWLSGILLISESDFGELETKDENTLYIVNSDNNFTFFLGNKKMSGGNSDHLVCTPSLKINEIKPELKDYKEANS